MVDHVIRPARIRDTEAIACAQVLSWQAAYRGVLEDRFLDDLSTDVQHASWLQRLNAGARVAVAEDADELVGFACHGPARDDDVLAGSGEVYALYVVPSSWGSGAGSRLLAAVVGDQEATGSAGVVLWVLENNGRARRFYERRGWEPEGAMRVAQIGVRRVTEVRYALPLPSVSRRSPWPQ